MNLTAQRITLAIQKSGLSYGELSIKTGIPKSSLQRYATGENTNIPLDRIEDIASATGVDAKWLVGWEDSTTEPTVPEIKKVLTKIPLYAIPVSAGTGQWLSEGHEYVFKYFEDVPEEADFALKVRGDSMEPLYFDDDIVFVKQNVIVESGQVGVFFLNDEGYLKMLQGNKLVSLNPRYKPIVIEEWDSFFCAGRVVGKVT